MKEILLSRAIESYLNYVLRYKNYEREYLQNMKAYFEYLNEIADGKNLNLRYKKECEALLNYAYELVVCKKKDCPALKSTKLERAVFYNSFVDYLLDATLFKDGKTKVQKLPPVMNELERKLDYVKNYREYKHMKQEKLARLYYVDSKTIRNDDSAIRNGYFNAFGQKIDIEYDAENKTLFSTPVPIFMVQNITQIVTILNGLGIMWQDSRYHAYAQTTAYTIWKQLTPYVKARIMDNLVEIMHLDREWYEHINRHAEQQSAKYFTEPMIAMGCHNLLMYFKNSMPVKVYYEEDRELNVICNAIITSCEETYFVLDGKLEILYEKLVSIEEYVER